MQFQGDAQIHVLVEGVVVGDERGGQAPRGHRVQHRSLHFEESPGQQRLADRLHHGDPLQHRRPGLLVDDEVDIPLAMTLLHILQPMPLVGERAQPLGEQRERLHPHAQFASLGGDHLAGGADPVASVQRVEGVEAFPEGGRFDEQLDVAGVITQHSKSESAHPPGVDQAAGDRHPFPGRSRRGEVGPAFSHRGRGVGAFEAHRVGVIPGSTHRLHLGEARRGETILLECGAFVVSHRRSSHRSCAGRRG